MFTTYIFSFIVSVRMLQECFLTQYLWQKWRDILYSRCEYHSSFTLRVEFKYCDVVGLSSLIVHCCACTSGSCRTNCHHTIVYCTFKGHLHLPMYTLLCKSVSRPCTSCSVSVETYGLRKLKLNSGSHSGVCFQLVNS